MILVVDDEPRRFLPRKVALEQRREELGEIEVVSDPDEALRRFAVVPSPIRLLILDLMLPPGEGFDEQETEYGTRTGLQLLRRFRELHPRIPVLLLTNARDDALLDRLRQQPFTWAAYKPELLAPQLVVQVLGMLHEAEVAGKLTES